MPRINPGGWIVAGIGGGSVSVLPPNADTWIHVASNAGETAVLDDRRFIFQRDAHLETYDILTGQATPIDTLGADHDGLAAGAGIYAARFNGEVRTSTGQHYPGAYVGDVGPDGSVLLLGADGTFQGRILEHLQAHGGGAWSATEGRRPVCSPDLPPANVLPGIIYSFRRFGPFCCYLWAADANAHGVFMVQHLEQPVGKVLAHTDSVYRSDLRIINGQLVVTYAETEGESPASVRRFVLDPATLVDPLSTEPATPPVPPVQPPVTPPPEEPTMDTPNRLEVAQHIAAQHPDLVQANTTQACGTLIEFIAKALHAEDADWGLLSKSPGEHQFNGHAVDAIIYRKTQQVIDLMSGAGDRDPDSGVNPQDQFEIRLKWGLVGKRPNNNWMDPRSDVVVSPPDPPTPPDPPAPPTPPSVPVPFIDQEVVDLIRDILASNQAQEQQIAGLRTDVARAAKALAVLVAVKPAAPKKPAAKKR